MAIGPLAAPKSATLNTQRGKDARQGLNANPQLMSPPPHIPLGMMRSPYARNAGSFVFKRLTLTPKLQPPETITPPGPINS